MRNFGLLIGVLSVVAGCRQPTVETVYLDYPIIDLSSQWIEFGEVAYGEPLTRSFVIQNRGDLALGISDIYEGRGQDANFEVTYDVANIVCPDSEEDTGAAKSWAPAPDASILLNPSDVVDFGVVPVGDSGIERITITNVGADPLTFSSDAFVTPRDQFFTIASGATLSSVTLTTGQEHQIFVDYTPTADGPHEAQLFIISNDPVNPTLALQLSGHTEEQGGGDDTDDPVVDDTGDTGGLWDDQVLFALDAGCRIPVEVTFTPVDVGEIYGSIIVETATQELPEEQADDEPAYWSDLDHDRSIIYLQGASTRSEGRMLVTPRSIDFGHIWAGQEEVRYVEVSNVGDGDLVLGHPYLDESCADAYSISWSYAPNDGDTKLLEGGAQTLLEVSFVPDDQNDAYCTLYVTSDDEDNTEERVYLQGNSGVDPTNNVPTVAIRSPEPGYVHNSLSPMRMEINIFDRDQPATSLTCRVKSSIIVGATVAYCTPPDESGHVYVDVPMDAFDPGVDTIQVLVTDVAGTTSMATVPVLINTSFPGSDDDGDGFGEDDEAENNDCNDLNPNTYPNAVEILDGEDNDCDLLIDEGTEGADDDGDTFTELDGDCDDTDEFTMPGGAEAADNKDNDCDGEVDEGTNLYDDDGDGYAEVNNDCADGNPDIHPGAIELCDNLDNNCNGRIDDACLAINSEPIIVGGVNMSQTAAEAEQSVQLSVLVFDADGQTSTYTWTAEEDASVVPFDAPAVTFTCPELPSGDAKLSQVYAVAQDPDGNQVWDFAQVACYPEGTLYKPYVRIVYTEAEGCATRSGSAGGMIALAGLGLAALRRRRDPQG